MLQGPVTEAFWVSLKQTIRTEIKTQGLEGMKFKKDTNKNALQALIGRITTFFPVELNRQGANHAWIRMALYQLALNLANASRRTIKLDQSDDAKPFADPATTPRPLVQGIRDLVGDRRRSGAQAGGSGQIRDRLSEDIGNDGRLDDNRAEMSYDENAGKDYFIWPTTVPRAKMQRTSPFWV